MFSTFLARVKLQFRWYASILNIFRPAGMMNGKRWKKVVGIFFNAPLYSYTMYFNVLRIRIFEVDYTTTKISP